MSKRSRIDQRGGTCRRLAVVGIFAFGAQASAEEPASGDRNNGPGSPSSQGSAEPVVAASSAVTLPLFGAPLVVDINVDPGGNLVDVCTQPARRLHGDHRQAQQGRLRQRSRRRQASRSRPSTAASASKHARPIWLMSADLASGRATSSRTVSRRRRLHGRRRVEDGSPDITDCHGHITARVRRR